MRANPFFIAALTSKRGLIPILVSLILVVFGLRLGMMPFHLATRGSNGGSTLSQNAEFFLLLLVFATGMVTLAIAVRLIHKQSFRSLITPLPNLDWGRFGLSFLVWFFLIAIGEILVYLTSPHLYVWSFLAKDWFPLAAISIFILPIQTSFEEILFRGYLLQRLGIQFNNSIVALIVTSVLFGLMHLANPEVRAFGIWTMMTYYISFGLFLGLCTLLDQRLEVALGVHAATNFYGATMVTFKESAIQTSALFSVHELNAKMMVVLFLLSSMLFFVYFARHYRWQIGSRTSYIVRFPSDKDEL